MEIKAKKINPVAVLPKRMHATDAGADLYCIAPPEIDRTNNCWIYDTGLAFEIPDGHFGLVVGRSSAYKVGARMNLGVIDSGYRQSVKVIAIPRGNGSVGVVPPPYKVGDRMAQLIIIPCKLAQFVAADELSASDRFGGLGSTGV